MDNSIIETIETRARNKLLALIQNFFLRLKYMTAIEPVIGNVIAIGFAIGILVLLKHPSLFPGWLSGKWGHYLSYAVYAGIALQFLKSASQSILLPLLALSIATIGFALQNLEPDVQILTTTVLQQCMFIGVLGMIISIYKIG